MFRAIGQRQDQQRDDCQLTTGIANRQPTPGSCVCLVSASCRHGDCEIVGGGDNFFQRPAFSPARIPSAAILLGHAGGVLPGFAHRRPRSGLLSIACRFRWPQWNHRFSVALAVKFARDVRHAGKAADISQLALDASCGSRPRQAWHSGAGAAGASDPG